MTIMRTRWTVRLLAGVAAALMLATMPAGASQTFSIAGGAVGSTSATRAAFERSLCTATALQGADGWIMEVSAGSTLGVTWSATARPAGTLSLLTATFFTADCKTKAPAGVDAIDFTGSWSLGVPGNAKWVVLAPQLMAGVNVTVS